MSVARNNVRVGDTGAPRGQVHAQRRGTPAGARNAPGIREAGDQRAAPSPFTPRKCRGNSRDGLSSPWLPAKSLGAPGGRGHCVTFTVLNGSAERAPSTRRCGFSRRNWHRVESGGAFPRSNLVPEPEVH